MQRNTLVAHLLIIHCIPVIKLHVYSSKTTVTKTKATCKLDFSTRNVNKLSLRVKC